MDLSPSLLHYGDFGCVSSCVVYNSPELFVVANAQDGAATEPVTPALFIFGDSLIDNGNNNYLFSAAKANYYPYGIDFGGPTGRFSNGFTVVDYGAQYLGLPLIPPYLSITSFGKHILRGINYASAAAGILDETGRHYGQRTSLSGQITQFQETVTLKLAPFFESQDALTQYLAKSVYLVDIGGNDYLNNYLQPERYDSSRLYSPESFADLLRDTLTSQVTNIYDLFNDMIHNPSKYGFIESNKACCGNGRNGGELTCLPYQQPCAQRDQYVFWDSFHPTQAANAIIARRGYSQYATDCTPINIYQLAQL